jgi:ubiquinone/menaquinone biosynthesis C-methylase UbiE
MGVYSEHLRPRLHAFALNDRVTGEVRRRICAGLTGDVLEIGYGSGLNQPHLPPAVTGIWAVEPSATALRLGTARRGASPVPVVLAGEDAQALDLPDDRFDAALCTWVLCGLPDPGAALKEVARVLKPGAALHFVEHGLAPDASVARWQGRLEPLQKRLAGGCHLTRRIPPSIEQAGFTVQRLETFYDEAVPKVLGADSLGVATLGSP